MKQKLMDILMSVTKPMIMNDKQIGEYRTPYWMAEALADALIENGVIINSDDEVTTND